MRCFLVLVWICSPSRILGFGIQLEGLIDLGPNWEYKYKFSPLSTTELPMISHSRKDRKDTELSGLDTGDEKDQSISALNILKISKKLKNKTKRKSHNKRKSTKRTTDDSNSEVKKYLISSENIKRDDTKIEIDNKNKFEDFMNKVYKQALKFWKDIQKKIESVDVKSKVATLKNYFKEKYQQFMNLFKEQKIKTKLGPQKFVLNTIETSNRIIERLVSSLSNYENPMKNRYSTLLKEVKRVKQLQLTYACKKFGVCNRNDDFVDNLKEFINIILQTDNAKIKQAADALTEVIKTNDFTQTIDPDTQKRLQKQMGYIELWDPLKVKSMFLILRNVLSHKNQPMVIMDAKDEKLSKKTLAFHEIIDTLNKNIHKSHNTTYFIKIKKQLEDWRDGVRKEVQNVFQALIDLIKKGLETMNMTEAQDFDKKMNIIMKPINIKKRFKRRLK